MKLVTNAKNCKMCAFCRFWYDPANRAIKPINPGIGRWEYDEKASSYCDKRTAKPPRKSYNTCGDWECKV